MGERPHPGDRVLDLKGDRLLPGLINAHDHLQLNGFPHLDYLGSYHNAGEWIRDFNTRLRADERLRASAAVPRAQRCFAGALKNLLSGVTTVAHHDPLPEQPDGFPTRVLGRFGWSHSLGIDGAEAVRAAYAATPASQPWIIHAAEGVDAEARDEFDRLEALGCLRGNTLLVHALALDEGRRQRLLACGAGIIWCPSSNLRLFGRTAEVEDLVRSHRVALGSDSRLTAAGDLLDELQVAREQTTLTEAELERIVTADSARLLMLNDRGTLVPGKLADLVVLPAGLALSRATRRDLRLVMLGGAGRYADGEYAGALDWASQWTQVQVDGILKYLQRDLAQIIASGEVTEAGVAVPRGGRAACG